MTSDKKIAANQNNAKYSTGPKTELGKQRSTSGVTQKRPMKVTSKPANGSEARGR